VKCEKNETEVLAMDPFHRKRYVTGDILLCGFIEAKVNERAANRIAASPTAYHKWHKLEEIYAKTSLAAQNGLTEKWNGLRQTSAQTVEQFIEQIDYLALEMTAAGIAPTSQAKLYTLLSGASNAWNTEIRVLKTQRATYEQSCEVLIEAGIERHTKEGEKVERALAAGVGGRGRGYGRGGYRGYPTDSGRGFRRQQNCQICGVGGHEAYRCPTGLKVNMDTNGRPIPRCFNCLAEGHRSWECPDPVLRSRGSFKLEDVGKGEGEAGGSA
jgi:hypothetical protein